MTVLDTGVLCGLMRREADGAVLKWLDRQPAESIWTTAISVFEVRCDLDLLPPGRRKRRLQEAFGLVLYKHSEQRIRPYDADSGKGAETSAAQRRTARKEVDFR